MIAEIKRATPNVQVSATYLDLRIMGMAGEGLHLLDLQSMCNSYAASRARGSVAEDEMQEARARAGWLRRIGPEVFPRPINDEQMDVIAGVAEDMYGIITPATLEFLFFFAPEAILRAGHGDPVVCRGLRPTIGNWRTRVPRSRDGAHRNCRGADCSKRRAPRGT